MYIYIYNILHTHTHTHIYIYYEQYKEQGTTLYANKNRSVIFIFEVTNSIYL